MWDHVIAKIGTDVGTLHSCKTHVDGVRGNSGRISLPALSKVGPWTKRRFANRGFIYFAADGKIVGLALRGAPRPDVSDIIDLRGGYAGFYGYVLATNAESFTVVCPEGAL